MKNDTELMLAYKEGDEEAFNVLFERHINGVINLLYKYLRDRLAAEDLSQEVFLRIYKAKDRYEPTAKSS